MSAGTDMFADVADLATALGLVGPSGDISTDFFVDPAQTVAGTLRDPTRRSALLQFLDDVLGDAAPQVTESGATWTPLLEISPTVHLYLVTADGADGVTVGVGVRAATTTSPTALGRLHLALATLPASGPAVFLPGSNSPEAIAQLVAEVEVGSADLQSVTLTATLPTGPGAVGDLAVSVTGLRVPGAATPLDLTLDSAAEIGPQLVATLSALLDSELQAVAGDLSGPATTLLGLFGLGPDSVVPLPLADLATRGVAALRDWLGQLGASEAALSAWFGHLAGLVGATVSGPDPLHATPHPGGRNRSHPRPVRRHRRHGRPTLRPGRRADRGCRRRRIPRAGGDPVRGQHRRPPDGRRPAQRAGPRSVRRGDGARNDPRRHRRRGHRAGRRSSGRGGPRCAAPGGVRAGRRPGRVGPAWIHGPPRRARPHLARRSRRRRRGGPAGVSSAG